VRGQRTAKHTCTFMRLSSASMRPSSAVRRFSSRVALAMSAILCVGTTSGGVLAAACSCCCCCCDVDAEGGPRGALTLLVGGDGCVIARGMLLYGP
jgi:hypothetical protein